MENEKITTDFEEQNRRFSSNIVTLAIHKSNGKKTKTKHVPILAPLVNKKMGDRLNEFILGKLNEHKDEILEILKDELEKHSDNEN